MKTINSIRAVYASIRIGVAITAAAVWVPAAFAGSDTYSWENFQSDIPGVAEHVDQNLVNPWGMAVSSGGTIWVSNNGTGTSTLYNQQGVANPLVVTIPGSPHSRGPGRPTGIVFNSTSFFKVTKNGSSQPARFIFVGEDGTISGWNPTLDQNNAIIAVDNGTNNGHNRAIYKGATLGTANGHNFLYVTNFHSSRVETYDENFHQVNTNGFVDPTLPSGYGPFGIRNLKGNIYVTYAKQDSKKEDDVPGPGNGFVSVFDTSGNFVRRLISNGNLNAPWGLALIEGDELWVGNFGDGKINNYDFATGTFLKGLMTKDGMPLEFQGLWDLLPLPGGVWFTAGIADEEHGLFGIITEDKE